MNKVKEEKIRKVFLEDLPRYTSGRLKDKINWTRSAELRCRVRFIYDGIEGEVEIIYYNKNNKYLTIKYLDKEHYEIYCGSFSICKLGTLLGKYTGEFKVEIGQVFKNEKRDIIITDRKIIKDNNNIERKCYKYKCNRCGYDGNKCYKNGEYREENWVDESSILKGIGCSVCSNTSQITVPHINSIVAKEETHWMIKYFQGEYDEAKMYTPQSNQEIYPICPDCNQVKNKKMAINGIYRKKSIGCSCGDGVSYPEKFMSKVIEQLDLRFNFQLSRTTFEWCKNYRYDFYFEYNNELYIIETHGSQHPNVKYYDNGYVKSGGRTYEQELENDRVKKELALANGIKEKNYIIVDCSLSNLEFIKDEVLDSRLNELFDLSKINWLKCEEFALSNLVKQTCEIKRDNPDMSTTEIGKIINLSSNTITKYLKKGTKLSWCEYDPKKEKSIISTKNGKANGKQVEVFKDDSSLGIFKNCSELERQSEDLFGEKLNQNKISLVCNGKRNHHKGFIFRYV